MISTLRTSLGTIILSSIKSLLSNEIDLKIEAANYSITFNSSTRLTVHIEVYNRARSQWTVSNGLAFLTMPLYRNPHEATLLTDRTYLKTRQTS